MGHATLQARRLGDGFAGVYKIAAVERADSSCRQIFRLRSSAETYVAGFQSVLGPAWKRIDYDVNGEWGCYLILDEFLNNAAESKAGRRLVGVAIVLRFMKRPNRTSSLSRS